MESACWFPIKKPRRPVYVLMCCNLDFDMDGKPDNTQDALEDPSYRFPGNYGV